MIALPHIAGRIFGEPLAIEPGKLDVIVSAIGPRLVGWQNESPDGDDTTDASPSYLVADGIATIDISGTLVSKTGGMAALSGLTSYADIATNFAKALKDENVLAIALAIDSPGGEVNGMFDLADMMYQARGTKPVCAVVNCAASAAYLLASTADRILVSRTGIVGSIGIIAVHLDESGADEQAGLKYTAIFAGDKKNDGNPHAPLSPEAKGSMQARIDQVYGMFTGAVARNRGIPDAAIRKTQAAVYMGQDGANAGLADSVGTVDDADALLRAAIAGGSKSLYSASSAASAARLKEIQNMEDKNAADAIALATANLEASKLAATNLAAAVATAKLEGYAEAANIVELCAIAGSPDAAKFIAARTPAADVRKALIDAKAAEQAKTAVDPSVMPGVDGTKDKAPLGKAKPWPEIMSVLGGKKEKR
jgi:signal peptide peptidase SppA